MTYIIAIDGPAGSGKGTIGRMLAKELGYAYLDTGLLYRAVGYLTIKEGIDPALEDQLQTLIDKLDFEMIWAVLPEPILRTEEIGIAASKVSAFQIVREKLLNLQHDFTQNPPENKKGVILDGRDIGTVICPNANIKFYMTADLIVRAERRFAELSQKHKDLTFEEVYHDIKDRDERDQRRPIAPLKKADDAIELNTSALNIEEAFQFCLKKIQENQ